MAKARKTPPSSSEPSRAQGKLIATSHQGQTAPGLSNQDRLLMAA